MNEKENKIKVDCFAFNSINPINGCNALTQLYCLYGNCKFYKKKGENKNEFKQD